MVRLGRGYPVSRIIQRPFVSPTYDNSAISAAQSGLASGTAFTWTQSVNPGDYAIIEINGGIFFGAGINLAATAVVTIGAATLTSQGSLYANNNTGDPWTWVFSGPTVGSGSQTASVTLTQGGQTFTGYGSSYMYRNVNSIGTLQTAFGSSTSASVSVPSAVGHRVWGSINANSNSAGYSGFTLTQRQTGTNSGPNIHFITGDTPGAPSVTVSASLTSNDWSAVGLDLI